MDPYLEGQVSNLPLERWGLINPSTHKFRCMACVYSGYHAVRRKFKTGGINIASDQRILTGPQMATAWRVFAETFIVEARELAVSVRQFSLPSFLALIQGDVQICIAPMQQSST